MSAFREPSPLNQPYSGALPVLKKELLSIIGNFFYRFEHEKHSKSIMSHLLRLYETMILSRAKEIGGHVETHAQRLMQLSADYANGHGKIEPVLALLEQLEKELGG